MAMPASACRALQRRAAQSVDTVPLSVSPNSDESGKQSLYPDGDSDRHQYLIIAHFQPSLKISCQSARKSLCKVANKETNNDENITILAKVIIIVYR